MVATPSLLECQGRLTVVSGDPAPPADQTAKTTVYFTPFQGNQIGLWDKPRSAWQLLAFEELNIKLTDNQYGDTTNGSPVIAGLADTSQLLVGMEVTGTGIPASTTISRIDNASTIRLNNNATATGTGVALSFYVPASKNVDVFAFHDKGSVKLEFSRLWTGDSTRADAVALSDGIYTKSADKTRRYLGTVRTTATRGLTEDSALRRFVWNNQHRVRRQQVVTDTTDSWTYTTAAWRAANNSNSNRVEAVRGLDTDPVFARVLGIASNPNSPLVAVGVGVDSVSVNAAQLLYGSATMAAVRAEYAGFPGVGYHYLQWLEYSQADGTTTWYGDSGVTFLQAGLLAEVSC